MRDRRIVKRAALFAAVGLLVVASAASATDADRAYLRDKLSFRYVNRPNITAQSPEILDNAAIYAGTESGAFWSSTQVPGLQGLVRSLLGDARHGGDGTLQFYAARIVKILDRPVMVMLLNDTTPLTPAAMNKWDACDDGNGRAWPCASNMSTADDARENCARALNEPVPARRDGRWAGQMTLGQTVFASGAGGRATSTFIHELVHTQDRSDRRAHMFWLSGRSYHYGSDGTHFGVEAVPNLAATYQEGIANTLRLMVDSDRARRMFGWFANNDVVYVEKVPPSTSGSSAQPCWTTVTAPSADIWLYSQLRAAGAREITRSPNPNPGYAYFQIRSIPPRFIIHNEYILALTFSEYARHLGIGKFLRALQTNDATLFRVSTSPIAQLFNTLCRAGLEGRSLSSVQGVSDAGPKPYMIPLAYADFFTGYQSRSKADFASIFEGMLDGDWVDLYWDSYKDEVRAAVPIAATRTPEFGDLTNIAMALGVRESRPE